MPLDAGPILAVTAQLNTRCPNTNILYKTKLTTNDDERTVLFMATVSDASQTQAAYPTLIWPPSPNTTLW